MTDTAIIRVAEETARGLANVDGEWEFKRLVPIYNGLVHAAKANHPNDPFLSTISTVETGEEGTPCVGEMRILFGLVRIALDSMRDGETTARR